MSDYSQAGSSGQPDDYSSPFDVDLGGQQRASLRSELRQMRVERDNADETRSLLETQVELLRKAQRDAGVAARVDGWRRQLCQPVFTAWCRLLERSRATRAVSQAEALTGEKESQVAALIDRVARVKSNASSKLSALSEANKELAAALELRDGELRVERTESKALRARAAASAQRESEAQAELDATARRLGEAEAAARRLESERNAARGALRAERQSNLASGIECELSLHIALASLSTAVISTPFSRRCRKALASASLTTPSPSLMSGPRMAPTPRSTW